MSPLRLEMGGIAGDVNSFQPFTGVDRGQCGRT